MENNDNNAPVTTIETAKKAWITGSIYALIVVLLLLLKATFNMWLLVLAGALIALFFHGLAGLIERKTHWNRTLCTVLSVIGTLLLTGGIFTLIGAKVGEQVSQLTETLPATIQKARNTLEQSELGKKAVEKITSQESMDRAQQLAQTMFRSSFGVLGDVYVVLFLGIFFLVSPGLYKKGIVQMVPARGRPKAAALMERLGADLKKWLKGKFFAMFVVFVLTAIGLLIMGVPMWLALSIIAGALNFIPNFGPLIAAIPAALVGLMDGPTTALIIIGLYSLIQVIESNFITPAVQQKLVNVPPALIIIAQLVISPLTGGWGLVLATPLLLIIMILVQELYVKPQNAKNGAANNNDSSK